MKKLKYIGIILPIFGTLLSLLLFLMVLVGGSAGAAGIPRYADDEKILEYCEYASSFGVNFFLVSLIDAHESYETDGTVDLTNKNPIETTLGFLCLEIEYWNSTSSVDIFTGEVIVEKNEYDHSEVYLGKDEILQFAGINNSTPFALRQAIEAKCEPTVLTAVETKIVTQYATWNIRQNPDTLGVMQQMGIPDDTARDLNEISRSGSIQALVEEATWIQILEILNKYGLYQDLDYDPDNTAVIGRMAGSSHGNYAGVVLSGGSAPDTPFFEQADERWYNIMYGRTGTIGQAGCGITAMTIIVNTYTNVNVTPVDMAGWSVENGHRAEGNGSYWSVVPGACMEWGIPCADIGRDSAKLRAALEDPAKLVVAIMGKGHFTSAGHFIVLRGVDTSGKVLVADPASITRSQMSWDFNIVFSEGKNFWICG